ncbi:MAG: GTP-binding protein, partial [Gammaproteobacteria bacterium]
MKSSSLTKLLLGLAVVLTIASVITVFLYTTDLAFSVWEHLSGAPLIVRLVYGLLALLVGAVVAWLLFKLFRPARAREQRQIRSEADLLDYISELEAQGIDTDGAMKELETLSQRKQAGEIHIALCGDISTGKSSLVKALLPQHDVHISPAGGSTREITQYEWTSPAGDRLIITDLPGLNEADGELD